MRKIENLLLMKRHGLIKSLGNGGLLPTRTLACRYCNEPIEVGAKQCPHCKEWLVYVGHDFEIDPWQSDFRDKDTERVDMIGPRAGCFSVLPLIFVIVCTLLLK